MGSKDAARSLLTAGAAGWSDTPKSGSVGVRQPHLLDLRTPRGDSNRLALTGLERQLVLDLLAGYKRAEIARRVSLDQGTLDARLAALFERLGVRDRLELALLLVHHGF